MSGPAVPDFSSRVESYLRERAGEFTEIAPVRRALLEEVARFVEGRTRVAREARLTFICTHNSRRSQLAQVWAQAAAANYGVPNVHTYSGGTEATAFDPRAVAALERAGVSIEKKGGGDNPFYEVRLFESGPPLMTFSKRYGDKPNPTRGHCAVMTCSQADEACPVVEGAAMRVAIPYDDPKAADGTEAEAGIYDERCRQICREMLYAFSRVERSD